MSSAYKASGGKLKFKGDKKAKKKKTQKEPTDIPLVREGGVLYADTMPVSEAKIDNQDEPDDFQLKLMSGSGRITTSGTTVQGHNGTKFMSELCVGDGVVVQHPTSLVEETKIVRMVLSDVSIGISSAFSSNSCCFFTTR